MLLADPETLVEEPTTEASLSEQPLADASTATRATPPAPKESGFDFSVGLGPPFAGLGIAAGMSFAVGDHVHVVPRVALGYFPDTPVTHGEGGGVIGVTTGVLTMVGKRHRGVVELNYGQLGRQYFSLNGYRFARTVWGPSLLVGYGYYTKNAFFVRAEIGPVLYAAPYSPETAAIGFDICAAIGKTF